MKKNISRYLALVLTLILSFVTTFTSNKSYAVDAESVVTLPQSVIDKASPFISLDGYTYKFNERMAQYNLSDKEVQLVQYRIGQTNEAISQALQDSNDSDEISVTTTSNKVIFTETSETYISHSHQSSRAKSRYKEGVSKVEFTWSGLRIYISRTDINHLGNLVLGNSIKIPNGIGQLVSAALGFTAGRLPGGIVFESTIPDLIFLRITNIRFQ